MSRQLTRLIPVSFSSEYDNEYKYITELKANGENVSKFICEAIREKIGETKEKDIPDLSNIFKRLDELEYQIKNQSEKVVYIPKDKDTNIAKSDDTIDEDLKQAVGNFDF